MEPIFDRFQRLRPLVRSHNTSKDKVKFIIRIDGTGQPYLSVSNTVSDIKSLPAGDYAVMRQLKSAPAGFNTGWNASGTSNESVDLWEKPYLVPMLAGVSELTDKNDNKIIFTGDTAQFILRIDKIEEDTSESKDKTKKNAGDEKLYPTPVIRYNEKDYVSYTFLSDNMALIDNMVVSIAPIGENFIHIRDFFDVIPESALSTYLAVYLSYFSNVLPEYNSIPARFSPNKILATPAILFEKVASDQALYLRVTQTAEDSNEVSMNNLPLSKEVDLDDKGNITVRDIEYLDLEPLASELEQIIRRSSPTKSAAKDVYREDNFFIIPAETASPFLFTSLPAVLRKFKLLGSDKLREYKVTPSVPRLNLNLSSGIDFLEGKAEVEIDNEKFTLADILEQFRKNRYVQLSDGNRAIIDERYMRRLERIFSVKKKSDKVKVSVFDLPEIEDLMQERLKGKAVAKTRELFEGFNKLKSQRLAKPPVKAKLRDYQKEGVKWIKYLHSINMGGCLADDMGLGKTLQTITVLASIYPEAAEPSLIVMPRSLLFNWKKELDKFAPQLTVETYYGADRALDKAMKAQVILTTYAMVRNDIEKFKDVHFNYVVLDESQNIKNVASQTTQAVTILRASHRLALSGTPMENNLTELYSLYRFLNPTMFGTLEDFNSQYTYPIQKNGDSDAMHSLRRKIFPFMLRRLKKNVLSELPARIEQTLYVEMNSEQQAFYNRRRLEYLEQIHSHIDREGIHKSQFVIFQALNELRRIASVPESLTEGKVTSSKIDELVENVSNAVLNGHKTVVFFNFIAGLEIVGHRLEEMGINCETMTGSTSAGGRKKIVERFQNDPECKVLLMTLKVGGVGLNLTAADTVFIFEPWWNKAAEEQAVNRLHRIGQKATVNSYSIIAVDTIEEKILQLQQQKEDLFEGLISDDSSSAKHLSEEDINFILG